MSSYELLSLAEDLRRQAAACARAAVAVERVCRGLDNVLDAPVALHKPSTWQSTAADVSRLRLHQRRSHLILLHYDIARVAKQLHARAAELQNDAKRVEMAAAAMLSATTNNDAANAGPLQHLSLSNIARRQSTNLQ